MKFLVLSLCFCMAVARLLPLPDRDIPGSVSLASGQRNAVHGWLWLPTEQTADNTIEGYWVHHTPEFWTTSPHDFQLILAATFYPQTPQPILPYPPAASLVGTQFTFTPPPAFSLNDLITSSLIKLTGNFMNGSFDTPYPRVVMTSGVFVINQLTTVHYLNETASDAFPSMPYLSYPRSTQPPSTTTLSHFYFSHLIHVEPDFDQVIHGTIDFNTCAAPSISLPASVPAAMNKPGATWVVPHLTNDLAHRLAPGHNVNVVLMTNDAATNGTSCMMHVLEEIHCVVGPGFGDNCPPLTGL